MEKTFQNWTPKPWPSAETLTGQWCRLEHLKAVKHGDDLFRVSTEEDKDEKFRYLFEYPPETRAEFDQWLYKAETAQEPFYYAVIDLKTNKAEGRQSFMRITPDHGVIEFGHLLWGQSMKRSQIATEACYLMLQYAFDDLKYRRVEWKCHADHKKSQNAALRFGFEYEGLFKQHLIFKGENRDTTWFAMTDKQWPTVKQAFQAWLSSDNFDEQGQQKKSLKEFQQ